MQTLKCHYLAASNLVKPLSVFDENQFRQAIRPLEEGELTALHQFIAELADGLIKDLACHQNLKNLQSQTNDSGQTLLMGVITDIVKESVRETAMVCESLAEQVLRFGKCSRSPSQGFLKTWRQKSLAVYFDRHHSDIGRVATCMLDELSRERTLKSDPKKKVLYKEFCELHNHIRELSLQLKQARIRRELLFQSIDKPDDLEISASEEGFDLICRSELNHSAAAEGDLQLLGS